MKKLYLKPSIEIIVSESVVMDTDSHGWLNGNEMEAKPNQPFFDWDDGEFADLWEEEEKENKELW